MKHRTRFTSIFATVIFFFLAIPRVSFGIAFNNSNEVVDYVNNAVENIHTSLEKITQIPENEQTYENTFKVWHRVMGNIADIENILLSLECSQFIHYFHSEIKAHVHQNAPVQNALVSYAQNSLNNEALNSFQRHVLQCFLNSAQGYHFNAPAYTHLTSTTNVKSGQGKALTVFNASSSSEVPVDSLLEQMRGADTVCLQDIVIGDANDLFDILQQHYAHFYMTTDVRGFLIASKYPIENAQYTAFSESNQGHGFIHFGINNGEAPLAQVYAAQLIYNGDVQLQQILETMELEFREDLPVLLCGDLRSAGDELIGAYFSSGCAGNSGAGTLLLNVPLAISGFQIETTPVGHGALLSLVKPTEREEQSYVHSAPKHNKEAQGFVILCEANEGNDNTWVDMTVRGDNDGKGNEKIEGKLGVRSGKYSASIGGNVGKDSNGNASYGVEGSVSFQIGGNDKGASDRAERAKEREERERADIEKQDRKGT